MNIEQLPWQTALRTALILGANVSIAFFIQLAALERKRSPLPLTIVLLGRGVLINLLGGIVFQEYISKNNFWSYCYEALITFQSIILWIFVFYTFTGDALKIVVTSMAAEIYAVALNGVVLAMINYAEGRESLLLSGGSFQPLDLLIPLIMYAVFLPLYFFFRDKLKENRYRRLKHRKLWTTFAGVYIFLGIMSWWNGYANRMSYMSWFIWLIFFIFAAGAGIVGGWNWINYMGKIEREHRLLKRQQEFLCFHKRAMNDQIQSMEENQRLIDLQMKEIQKLGGRTLSGERAKTYLKQLKQEYHNIKAGVYCSEWEIDAVLYYYSQKAEENEIVCSFYFGNYRRGSVKHEYLSEILLLLLEESIEKNLTVEKGERRISLSAGTVRNQVLLSLETVGRGKFRTWKLRTFAEKHQGLLKYKKKEKNIYIKLMIPCTESYKQSDISK